MLTDGHHALHSMGERRVLPVC